MKVIFYEKPGCGGNAKQKKLLELNYILYETRDILSTAWDKTTLNSFFQDLEKEEIINKFAPQVKSGEVDINTLSKDELIERMIQEPILIKRPLLIIGEKKICGFDIEKINDTLRTNICESISISTCQSKTPCKSV